MYNEVELYGLARSPCFRVARLSLSLSIFRFGFRCPLLPTLARCLKQAYRFSSAFSSPSPHSSAALTP
jgi:hypothetical protein